MSLGFAYILLYVQIEKFNYKLLSPFGVSCVSMILRQKTLVLDNHLGGSCLGKMILLLSIVTDILV